MSIVIVMIAFILIGVGILLKISSVLQSENGTIALISISFICEIIGNLLIFILFVKDTHSKEYENLKVIGEIEKYLKNNKEKKFLLHFDLINKSVLYDRIKTFMNIYDSDENSNEKKPNEGMIVEN